MLKNRRSQISGALFFINSDDAKNAPLDMSQISAFGEYLDTYEVYSFFENDNCLLPKLHNFLTI